MGPSNVAHKGKRNRGFKEERFFFYREKSSFLRSYFFPSGLHRPCRCIIFRAVPHRRPPSHSPFDFIDCKFFRLLSDRHDCHIVSFHKMPIYDPSVKFDNIPICFSWTEKGNLRPSTCLPFLSIFSRPASELFGKIGTE